MLKEVQVLRQGDEAMHRGSERKYEMSGRTQAIYNSAPKALTQQEKLEIYYLPQLEEDIRPRYRRFRDEAFWRDDLKMGTVRCDYRLMLAIIDNLLAHDSVLRCIRSERELKKKVVECAKWKKRIEVLESSQNIIKPSGEKSHGENE
jgi:hypothetical protein